MKNRYVFLWTLCVFLMLGMPVTVVVNGLSKLLEPSKNSIDNISAIRISSADSKLKRSKFVFSRRRTFVKNSSTSHIQGYVKIGGKKYPAGASKIGNKLTVTYPSRIVNKRQRMNTLVLDVSDVNSATGRLKSVPMSLTYNNECGAKHEEHVHSSSVMPLNEGMPANTALFATIHTYADQEFYAKYGTSTNDHILSLVNSAEAIYSTQLGIRFNVVGQTIFPTSNGLYDPSQILSSFRNDATTQNNDVDLKHLFTGKDMTGMTIGIAYVSAICYAPNYSYGVTQDYYSLTSLVFAHEIGHNFGASHSSEYSTVMYPSISSTANRFSNDSINAINSHLNYFGSCLDVDTVAPDLTQAKLFIKRKSRIIYGTLTDSSGVALGKQNIVVSVNGKKFGYTTNTKGVYRHFLKVTKRKRRYVVFSSTQGSQKVSRVLKFTV